MYHLTCWKASAFSIPIFKGRQKRIKIGLCYLHIAVLHYPGIFRLLSKDEFCLHIGLIFSFATPILYCMAPLTSVESCQLKPR